MTEVTVEVIDSAWTAMFLEGGELHKLVARAALRTQNKAKQRCPVDTGRLRSSIEYTISSDANSVTATIGSNVFYAPYVEFGTSKIGARPFLRSSVSEVIAEGLK